MTAVNHKRGVASILFALVVGAVVAMGVSAPASAATPVCNTVITGVERHNSLSTSSRPAYFSGYIKSLNCVMYKGASNYAGPVKTLQKTLNACYGSGIAEDGSYGPGTKTAVTNAQAADGMPQPWDGSAGPYTLSHMGWKASDGHCPSDADMFWTL